MAKCPNEGDCEISLRREAQLQPWRAQSEKACLLSSLFGTQISDILSALDQSNVENMLGIHPSALGEKKHIHWTLFDMHPTTVSRTDVRLVGYWPVSLSCAHTRRTSAKTYQICLALSRKKKFSSRFANFLNSFHLEGREASCRINLQSFDRLAFLLKMSNC